MMRTSRAARERPGRGRRHAIVGAAVLIAAAVGTVAVAPPAAAAGLCDLNSVTGTTVNTTGQKLELVSAEHGVTNAWCNVPEKNLAPDETDHWQGGDNLFQTTVYVAYAAPNGDLISLSATSRIFAGPEASCDVTPNVNRPTPYRCQVDAQRNNSGGRNDAQVKWTISLVPM